eukprot:scaffold230035_cov35-Tisochrysis_lutea.AAC.1
MAIDSMYPMMDAEMAVGMTRPSLSKAKDEKGGKPLGIAPTTRSTLSASSPSHCVHTTRQGNRVSSLGPRGECVAVRGHIRSGGTPCRVGAHNRTLTNPQPPKWVQLAAMTMPSTQTSKGAQGRSQPILRL